MENCQPEKTNVGRGDLHTGTSSTLRLISKQSRSREYLSLHFELRKFKRSYVASQNL